MQWPEPQESPGWWPGSLPTKRPADEALDCNGGGQLNTGGPSKRLCITETSSFTGPPFQCASPTFQPGPDTGLSSNLWAGDVGVGQQPMATWSAPAYPLDRTTWNSPSSLSTLGYGTNLLGYNCESASASMLWTQDATQAWRDGFSGTSLGQQPVFNRDMTLGNDLIPTGAQGPLGFNDHIGAQPSWDPIPGLQGYPVDSQGLVGDVTIDGQADSMDVDLTYGADGTEHDTGPVNGFDSSSASEQDIDESSGMDDDPVRQQTTAATTPSPLSKTSKSPEEDSVVDLVFDTCFGLLIIEDVQLHDKVAKDGQNREVSMELCGSSVLIRDLQSKAYAGLVGQESSEPLLKLVTNKAIKLSGAIRSATMLEVLVYGCRAAADAIGEMLLDHDCFLQQPGAFDDSMTYFNPQCLVHQDGDIVMMQSSAEAQVGNRAAHLNISEKSKVAELLDSASGPSVFRSVQASEMLQTTLKEYQLKALAMMVEKELGELRDAQFPSVWVDETEADSTIPRFLNTITGARIYRKPKICLGGLLADDMGLGKTLTTLALIAGSAVRPEDSKPTTYRATLIIAPLSTLTGWEEQIERHFKKRSLTFITYHGSDRQKNAEFLTSFDIVLTTYDTVRTEHIHQDADGKAQGVIQSIAWHRVVLDEAHIIQNRASKRFQAIYALQSHHRWCLTGTPIQHRLEDLSSLVEFLRVDPFDSPATFRRTFTELIDRQDSRGWDRLRALVRAISLRRTKTGVQIEMGLPPRREVTCEIFLDIEERKAYDLVKRRFAMAIDQGGGQMNAFQLILRLRQICNHGVDLLPTNLRKWIRQASEFYSQSLLQMDNCDSCGRVLRDHQNVYFEDLPCAHQICHTCRLDVSEEDLDGFQAPTCPLCPAVGASGCGENNLAFCCGLKAYRPSSKVRKLLRNLRNDIELAIKAGTTTEKSVVFSAWTGMLDLIEKAFMAENIEFQRVDGTKTFRQRENALRVFKNNKSCHVLLASLGSAAIGLDLSMATRVHLIEPGWNPMLERQALDRIHRLGQTRHVTQFRYIVQEVDSVELYMLQRQEWKMALIEASVVDTSVSHKEMMDGILQDMSLALRISEKI